MKPSRNDPFDPRLCLRGLVIIVTYMHSDAYEFLYYFTFKRSMKAYAREFNDAWEQSIDHDDFFEGNPDPFVQNCRRVQNRLIDFKLAMILRLGIDEFEDHDDEELLAEAQRYRPYLLAHKRSKSYKKLKSYFDRAISGYIDCLYKYACALTVEGYKIPLVFKKQFLLDDQQSLRLLNQDNNQVELLIELITDLKKDLLNLRFLMEKRISKAKK